MWEEYNQRVHGGGYAVPNDLKNDRIYDYLFEKFPQLVNYKDPMNTACSCGTDNNAQAIDALLRNGSNFGGNI